MSTSPPPRSRRRPPACLGIEQAPAALVPRPGWRPSFLRQRQLVGGSHSGKWEQQQETGGRGTSSSSSAEISDYFGFVRVAAAVGDALVFAPSPGMRLEGTVARVGGDYVGVLALGVFSAAVGGEALSRRFELEEVAVRGGEEGRRGEEAAAAAAGEAARRATGALEGRKDERRRGRGSAKPTGRTGLSKGRE